MAFMQQGADRLRRAGKRIVLVPTMGCLHKGHQSLMRLGRKIGDHIVVSVFVNPTQFGPSEDLETYPRNLDRDIELAEDSGVDTIFAPSASSMYDKGYQTYVYCENLPQHLCGLSRPTHFRGVCSVVAKLFNIVKPHAAVFGEKDFQQLAVIRRMTEDLNFDIKIICAPIVREDDGLAVSSRNLYLSEEERVSASVLFRALRTAQGLVKKKEVNSGRIIDMVKDIILGISGTTIDYISICDPETLEDVERVEERALLALAVYVGKTRLIDNIILKTGITG